MPVIIFYVEQRFAGACAGSKSGSQAAEKEPAGEGERCHGGIEEAVLIHRKEKGPGRVFAVASARWFRAMGPPDLILRKKAGRSGLKLG